MRKKRIKRKKPFGVDFRGFLDAKKVRNKSMPPNQQPLFSQLFRNLIRLLNAYSRLYPLNSLNSHFL